MALRPVKGVPQARARACARARVADGRIMLCLPLHAITVYIYGPIQLWPYIVLALYSYDRI